MTEPTIVKKTVWGQEVDVKVYPPGPGPDQKKKKKK